MATRVISTKLAIEGESSYRQSISKINGEIKQLQSSLKLTESTFRTNANSMEALKAKGDSLSALYEGQKSKVDALRSALDNAQTAEERYRKEKETLTGKIQENNRALEALKSTEGDTSRQVQELEEQNRKLTAQLETCDSRLSASEKGVASWKNQLNRAQIELNDLGSELQKNRQYMAEAEKSADGCATSIDRYGDKVQQAGKQSQDFTEVLAGAGMIAALKKTADLFISCGKSSISFESAMAGVAKTTDLTQEELNAMGKSILEMSGRMPASAQEIAAVMESAGQLGIAKNDLLSFTEVMVNLGTTTNLSSEEAASALAKFANVTKMAPSDYSRLGSAIVDLGNNFATTESDIVSMSTRLAASGSVVGLSQPQILAMATALSSLGIEAEAGGSAIGKLLKQFETMVATGSDKLEGYARIAGMTAEEFRVAWGKNAAGALTSFVDGLGQINDSGGSVAAVLDELGLTEVRMSNAVLALSGSDGILQKALETADKAWSQDTALKNEANIRYDTTESKIETLKNKAETLKTTFGEQLNPVVDTFVEMSGNVLDWATGMVEESGKLAPLLASCATGMGLFVTGVAGYNLIGKLANTLLGGLVAVADANPIFITATAVAALAGAVALFVEATKEEDPAKKLSELTQAAQALPDVFKSTEDNYEKSKDKIDAAYNVVERYISRLRVLEGQGKLTADEQAEYSLILEKIKALVPDLNIDLDEQTGLLKGGADALRDQVQQWKDLAIQEALHDKLTGQLKAYAAAELELEDNKEKRSKAKSEYISLEKQHSEAVRAQIEAEKQLRKLQYDSAGNLINLDDIDRWNYWNDQLAKAKAREYELTEQRTQSRKELDLINEAVRTGEQVLDDYEEKIKGASESMEQLMAGSDSASSSGTFTPTTDAIAQVQTQLQELAKAYKEAYDAAYDSINGQIGLFDEFSLAAGEKDLTAEQMINNMKAQAENIAAYTENLRKAQIYGLDQALISKLSDGSNQSAKYIATIISEIEKAGAGQGSISDTAKLMVEEFNRSFLATQDAKTGFADAVARMGTGFEESLTKIGEEAAQSGVTGYAQMAQKAFEEEGVNFQQIGAGAAAEIVKGLDNSSQDAADAGSRLGGATGDGMIAGLQSRSGALYGTIRGIVRSAIRIAQEEADVHSPSRKTTRIFENVGDGMILGMENRREKLNQTVRDIVAGALDFETGGKIPELIAGINLEMPQVLTMPQAARTSSAMGGSVTVSLHIENFTNKSDRDLDEICEYVEDRIQTNYLKKEAAI